MYIALYPNMTAETFIPFEEFYNPKKKVKIQEKSEGEILTEVKEILDAFAESR